MAEECRPRLREQTRCSFVDGNLGRHTRANVRVVPKLAVGHWLPGDTGMAGGHTRSCGFESVPDVHIALGEVPQDYKACTGAP